MPRGKFICNECHTGKVDREGSFSKEGLSFSSSFVVVGVEFYWRHYSVAILSGWYRHRDR